LRDVADQHQRRARLLRGGDEQGGGVADLGEAAGHRALLERDGLDRVDDREARAALGEVGGERRRDRLARSPQAGAHAEPVRPPRLLAGDVEDVVAARGGGSGELEQQGRLPDAGLAGEQHGRPRHYAAAEYPVDLGLARREAGGGVAVDAEEVDALGRPRRSAAQGWPRGRRLLDDAAPGAAARAATERRRALRPALGADVRGGYAG